MTITRAVETWALAVLATLGTVTPFTRRLDAQETAPTDAGVERGVNDFPQVTCRAVETAPEYAIAYRTPRGQRSYGSRMTLTVTLLYDATDNDTTPEAADLAMADIRAAFRQPPEVDASAFGGLIVFDEQSTEISIDGDNREHVFTVELAAVLKT